MPRQPDPSGDPYRTLGLEPGASLAEVKRAYRLLAKAFHPDSAGEAAVHRFLAVQEAYELLKSGRAPSASRAARTARTPAPPAEPWRADPARARAARERARTARGSSAGAGGATRSGGSPGRSGPAPGASTRADGPSGGAGGRGATGTGGGARGGGRRRDVRKATMGSTSYDEARDPGDATWSGASWYGPSSGEYWIVNPREYADPRKHGPEYLERARRPLAGDRPAATATADAAPSTDAGQAAGAGTAWRAAPPATSGGGPRPRPTPGWGSPAADLPRDRPGEAAPGASSPDPLDAPARAWLGGPADDPTRRLGLALVAWPPIGLAAAAAIGEITGCTAYAATCGGAEPMLPWLAQAVILGLLLLMPPLTRLLAGGAVATILALVPVTAFLIAVGGGGAPQAGFALAFLLGAAWLAGVGWTALGMRRRLAAGDRA